MQKCGDLEVAGLPGRLRCSVCRHRPAEIRQGWRLPITRPPQGAPGRPSFSLPRPRLSRFPIALPLPYSAPAPRSEEHTSELQSLMRISYAVFCLKKKNTTQTSNNNIIKKTINHYIK